MSRPKRGRGRHVIRPNTINPPAGIPSHPTNHPEPFPSNSRPYSGCKGPFLFGSHPFQFPKHPIHQLIVSNKRCFLKMWQISRPKNRSSGAKSGSFGLKTHLLRVSTPPQQLPNPNSISKIFANYPIS